MGSNKLYQKQLGYMNSYKRANSNLKLISKGTTEAPARPLGTAMTAAALQQQLSLSLGLPTLKSTQTDMKQKRRRRIARRKSDEEYVLDEQPPPPTLAQRYGLAEPPPASLSEQEWEDVKLKSVTRGDNIAPCVICKEEFGLVGQVLLSCSHVFHRECLKAFERYSGRKTCPMCRRAQYETRVIHEGAKRHKHNSATLIQAAWRGYKVRRWYTEYRERNPPSDPVLRTKYFEKKLSGITCRMLDMVNTNRETTDKLCLDIDMQLTNSRRVMQTANIFSGRLSLEKWKLIEEKAYGRGDTVCPICIGELQNKRRPVVLLSCSHLYHRTCMEMFENLTTDISPTCPVCRAEYIKRSFSLL